MAEEFEGRDLSESVFWGVDLRRALVRDADLSGTTFFHTLWDNVTVDGVIRGLVVNGVDVTDYVNAHDRWYPLRTELEPSTAEGIRSSWAKIAREWTDLLGAVSRAEASVALASVDGEWSLRDTLRHLLFAMDKWFTLPILGDTTCSPLGLPNTGSQDREWPGVDMTLQPTFDEVLAARSQQQRRFDQFVAELDLGSLPETVDVLENGEVSSLMCFHVVLEEEFEHLRYVLRDLAALGVV